MRKFALTLAAIVFSAGVLAGKADAMPIGSGIGSAADGLSAVEQTQYVWGGRNYCWYPDGWRGPGWYWCGYHLRRGFGWGGPMGWRGWRHGGPAVVVAPVGPRRAVVVGPRGGVAVVGPRGGRVIRGPRRVR